MLPPQVQVVEVLIPRLIAARRVIILILLVV